VAALPAGLQGKVTVNVLPQRFQLLVKSLRRGRVRLDPPPSFGTCLHMAYYLEQTRHDPAARRGPRGLSAMTA
jgi:hypothetical protein